MTNQTFEKAYNAFKSISKKTFNSKEEFLTLMARNGFALSGYTKEIFLSNVKFNYGDVTSETLRKYSKRMSNQKFFEENFTISI